MNLIVTTFEWGEGDVTVEYSQEDDIIIVDINTVPQTEVLRGFCEKVLKFLREESVTAILTDTAGVSGGLSSDDEQWLAEVWGPKVEATGLEHQALVLSKEYVELLSVDDVVESEFGSDVRQRLFADRDEARQWLRACTR